MSTQQYLIDAQTRHAVFIQRYGAGQANAAKRLLERLRLDIMARLAQEPTEFQYARLHALLSDLNQLASDLFINLNHSVLTNAKEFMQSEASFTQKMLSKGTDGAEFVIPADSQLELALTNSTLRMPSNVTETVTGALNKYGNNKSAEIMRAVQDGIVLGDTTPQIAQNISGMINNQHKNQVESLVRTITNHASSVTRNEIFEENDDLLEGYQWVATLDGRTTLVCAGRDGKVYPNGSGIYPPAHFGCVLPDTLITSAMGISSATKRIFKGKVITINTVSGNQLTVTPNHPILTSKGWAAAESLNVGDKCVNQRLCERVGGVDGDDNSPFKTAKDIFESFSASSCVSTREVEVSSPDFHGDGIDNEVAQISTTSDLSFVFNAGIVEHGSKGIFNARNMMRVYSAFKRFHKLALFLKGFLPACCSNVGFFGKRLFGFRACGVHSDLLLFRSISESDAVSSEDSLNGTWADAEHIGYASDTYAGGVFFDDIVSVEVSEFSGHVYNLHTLDHCYSANGIVTHNCRSTTIPKVKDAFNIGSKLKGSRPQNGDTKGTVSGRVTYGGWLKRQSKEFQNEALGTERAKLFRSGDYNIQQFTDPTGRAYKLSELNGTNSLSLG